jgi:SNF2 family DNA or RNA helicase
MGIKTKYLKHQDEDVKAIHNKSYWALIADCGTGKTLTTLGIIDQRKQRFPQYTTLVIVPNTLIENWQEEIQKHSDLTCVALRGSQAKRTMLLSTAVDIMLINYEGARIIPEQLIARKFDFVVFDESQNLKGHTTLQSKACFRIAMACPHRLILTGTPIHNGPLDCFGQYRVLSPDIFGSSYFRFRARYAMMGGYMGKQVIKYINMSDFKDKILRCSTLRKKEEVLDLPPRLYETIRVDMTDEQTRMYKQLRDVFITECQSSIVTAPVMLTRLIRFSQITAGFYKDITGKEISYAKNPKQEWLIEWLKDHGHKTVVFVRFIKELHDLEDALNKADISFVSVYGATEERIEVVKRFNNMAGVQVFIGQIDTAGQGINLQSASYCVFLSNNYSYGDREQAESRIHRQGQLGKNCTYLDIVCRGTIDERVLSILKKKESLAGMLTNDLIKVV